MKHTDCYIEGYPRPQFVRKEWMSLDGIWEFAFDDEYLGTAKKFFNGFTDKKIVVPYTYETILSKINEQTPHEHIWYSRTVVLANTEKRVIINFEGVDYSAKLYVNGQTVGCHSGAYSRFSFDITKFVTVGMNNIVVEVTDSFGVLQPRGKQRWKGENFGCWYVQTTGIYKSVWLEYLSDAHLEYVKITPSLEDYSVTFDCLASPECVGGTLECEINYDGKFVHRSIVDVGNLAVSVKINLNSVNLTYQAELWSESNPKLYDVKFSLLVGGKLVDSAGSYFGLREITISGNKVLFNSVPLYQKLILEQGYWEQSHLTPPDIDAMIEEIKIIKQMGYNGIRIHQKVEDERFLYYADIMGLYVWCEMPSPHWFNDDGMDIFADQWRQIVRQNYNHPSIITWVVYNESWGIRNIANNIAQQNFTQAMYYLTKSYDIMRPVISNDGWEHTKSDILTLHHYEQNSEVLYKVYDNLIKAADGWCGNSQKLPYAKGFKYENQPIIISEFGGTAYDKDTALGWGYGDAVKNDEEFIERFEKLTNAIKKMEFCCGYCYTQVSDIQQEVNGLLYSDRKPKIPLNTIKQINNKN